VPGFPKLTTNWEEEEVRGPQKPVHWEEEETRFLIVVIGQEMPQHQCPLCTAALHERAWLAARTTRSIAPPEQGGARSEAFEGKWLSVESRRMALWLGKGGRTQNQKRPCLLATA
jgi:hypothetical protein